MESLSCSLDRLHPPAFMLARVTTNRIAVQSRREALRTLGGLGTVALMGAAGCSSFPLPATHYPLDTFRPSPEDTALLVELEQSATRFFIEAAHPETGLVMDRKQADGQPDSRTIGSIAATGFGLSVLCVAHHRDHAPLRDLELQVEKTLSWLAEHQPHHHGFFYHFFHWGTGERIWKCELSSIDSAILFCGVIHARNQFHTNPRIQKHAATLLDRIDWNWFLDGHSTVSMGWKPEDGFLKSRWDHYCELMMIYLLGLSTGSSRLSPDTWAAWSRPERVHEGQRFIWSPAPLFVHQFSHAWFDFRDRVDGSTDWFENSIAATRAHLGWSLRNQGRFPKWNESLWGVSSSDSEKGYVGWGGPPDSGPLDGTIVPCASAGSLPFLPAECLRTLHTQRRDHGHQIWKRYGFVDAWNPHTSWVNPDVIGIDVGITALMAANTRDQVVWKSMQRDPVVRRGFERAGFATHAVRSKS